MSTTPGPTLSSPPRARSGEADLKRVVRESVAERLPTLLQRALLGPYLTPKTVCEPTGWSPRELASLREQRRVAYR